MSNTILTPTAVTNEALRILHNKAQFIGTINKQYDSSFAQSGAKIGDSLKIRLPNQYTVRTGAVLDVQDTSEDSTTLQVATQKGVDLNFSSVDLTLSLDDFSERILQPAMSVLAANIEQDCYLMYKDVYQMVDNDTAAISLSNLLEGRRRLTNVLTPIDSNRKGMLGTLHSQKIVDALKTLFQSSTQIKEQYEEGMLGRAAGFDWYENPIIADHTTGTAAKGDTLYDVSGANQSGATLTVTTGTTSFLVGDIITIAGCNEVHPETKADLGYAKQFVITANSGTSATSLAISPAIVLTGAKKNVSAAPTDTGAVTKVGAGNGELLNTSMVYHRDAFTFATADLVMPNGVDFAARKVMDGISMRIVRQYDINNDKFPCRIDVLYGRKAIRPQMACRIHADG